MANFYIKKTNGNYKIAYSNNIAKIRAANIDIINTPTPSLTGTPTATPSVTLTITPTRTYSPTPSNTPSSTPYYS